MNKSDKAKNSGRFGTTSLVAVAVLMVYHMHQSATSCDLTVSPPSFSPEINTTVYLYENLSNPVVGLFPGWDGGSPIDRTQLDAATRQLIPARLIAVFGLESSGTTFLQHILAKATGATKKTDVEFYSPDFNVRVQHFSLPSGWFPKKAPRFNQQFEPLPIAPVFIPLQCRLGPGVSSRPAPPQCHKLFGPQKVPSASRYFVNVTSHLNFYRQRGVDTTAVVVIRDPALHFRGITKNHCWNQTAAFEQYKTGRTILQYAMDHLDPSSFIIVSYETLMTLQGTYLKEIYKSMGIQSDYVPKFKNGNIPYIPEGLVHPSIKDKLNKDTGVSTDMILPLNIDKPKSHLVGKSQARFGNYK